MSSGSYKQQYVVCPFYKYDDGHNKIVCEGLFARSRSVSCNFPQNVDYRWHMNHFCCCHYKKCPLYRALEEKYE